MTRRTAFERALAEAKRKDREILEYLRSRGVTR